jgi:hypothetical protein
MRHVTVRPFGDPVVAARKLLEIASAIEVVQDGRIYIETINRQFLFEERGVRCRASARHRPRLALEARVGHVCEIHGGGRGPVRIGWPAPADRRARRLQGS